MTFKTIIFYDTNDEKIIIKQSLIHSPFENYQHNEDKKFYAVVLNNYNALKVFSNYFTDLIKTGKKDGLFKEITINPN